MTYGSPVAGDLTLQHVAVAAGGAAAVVAVKTTWTMTRTTTEVGHVTGDVVAGGGGGCGAAEAGRPNPAGYGTRKWNTKIGLRRTANTKLRDRRFSRQWSWGRTVVVAVVDVVGRGQGATRTAHTGRRRVTTEGEPGQADWSGENQRELLFFPRTIRLKTKAGPTEIELTKRTTIAP